MISLLCPTRGRPEWFARMVEAAVRLSSHPIEILAYVDSDDERAAEYSALDIPGRVFVGEPCGVGRAWNYLARMSSGAMLMMANDDMVPRTRRWAKELHGIAQRYRDGIYVIWPYDGAGKYNDGCVFPIVSRRWYEAVGRFVPECFRFHYHDTWLYDVGKRLGRTRQAAALCEHMHFGFKKAPRDETYAMHHDAQEDRDFDETTWATTAELRAAEAETLRVLKGTTP